MKWNEIEMEWNVMKPHMMTGTYQKKKYGELSQKMPTPNEMKWIEVKKKKELKWNETAHDDCYTYEKKNETLENQAKRCQLHWNLSKNDTWREFNMIP